MPEIGFFVSAEDEACLVSQVFAMGGRAVPAVPYLEPTVTLLTDFPAYSSFRGQTNLFFLEFDNFLECPLEMRRVDSGVNAGRYFVLQRNGGPVIDLFVPKEYPTEKGMVLPAGSLGYYPTYWNAAAGSNRPVPAALKTTFAELRRHLQRGATKVRCGQRLFWVGRHTSALRGMAILLQGVDT